MKKIILPVVAALCLGALSPDIQAQTSQAEKTYEISGKAKRGTLANVEFVNSQYVLYYVTKTNSRKMKFEIYSFDKDFNFVSKVDDELEFEQAKTKYKWFKFKKEEYSVEGLSVEPNMMGTLVLKKKRVTYSFDPIFWGYRKKVEVLDKVKPKTEDGNKLFYFTHVEDDNSGDAYILVGEKAKGMKEMKTEPDRQYKKYHVMRFNKDCDLVSDVALEFQYPVVTTRVTTLPAAEVSEPGVASIGDICIMFAPARIKGVTKDENPNKTEFTFVRLSNQNKELARVNFNSPSPGWRVDDLIYDDHTGDIFYYGPSAEGKDEYQNQAVMNAKKFRAVQLMKLHNNQVEYITSTNLEEFESKLKTPPSQKKSPAYNGKKFSIASYHIPVNGDFVVVGQNFDPGKEGLKYKDVLAFHFDPKGILRSQYGLDIIETNQYAQSVMTPQQFLTGANTNNLYWFVKEIDGVNGAGRVLTYGRIGKINMSDASIGDFKILGSTGKKPEYFLDPNFPYLNSETPGTIVFFGSDKKEKTIWFNRIFLD